ncbi:hypothetical protein ASNO1_50250 [Corallococcus caeni]|uniref:Uncharacterized protein n=1 Tax=Corallococcus caeni TaxID=3082388 RepID=A0ABQ6QXL3_9BACT|nr:hypothetical protein ASNO1_50250 [Corallococcus sp. NO1]
MQEREEELGRRRVRRVQEEPQAAAPEPHVEDGLLQRLAPIAGQVAVGPQGPVEDALGGVPREDAGKRIGRDRAQAIQRGPGLRGETKDWIEQDS